MSPWHYECVGGYCKKTEITPETKNRVSLDVCQLFCGVDGALWPKPTGRVSLGQYVAHLDPEKINLHGINPRFTVGKLLTKNVDLLKSNTKKIGGNSLGKGGFALDIYVHGFHYRDDVKLTLQTKENYSLKISQTFKDTVNFFFIILTYFFNVLY